MSDVEMVMLETQRLERRAFALCFVLSSLLAASLAFLLPVEPQSRFGVGLVIWVAGVVAGLHFCHR